MGVTIHFEGSLREAKSLESVVRVAREFAAGAQWPTESLDRDHVTLERVRGGSKEYYSGPVRGIALYPHPDCEPFRLEFDGNLYIQEYSKTQFAGAAVHARLIDLLRRLQPYFRHLEVLDEGEYWHTGDLEHLEQQIRVNDRMIHRIARLHPDAKVMVRFPDGRIGDAMYRPVGPVGLVWKWLVHWLAGRRRTASR